MKTFTDRIEKKLLLKAPRSRVWRALSNAEEFGGWFGAALQGKTFAAGKRVQGQITIPGYEYITFDVSIQRMEPERLISWRWHPSPVERGIDYSQEPTTQVVFELEEVAEGTLLTVIETGFDALPPARRAEAFRGNNSGWDGQLRNIERHAATP
jgi:uncharacterized protein YndB with AHSA1/START domain